MNFAIETRLRPATERRGARILAEDEEGRKTEIPYSYNLSPEENHRHAALMHLSRWTTWDPENYRMTSAAHLHSYFHIVSFLPTPR